MDNLIGKVTSHVTDYGNRIIILDVDEHGNICLSEMKKGKPVTLFQNTIYMKGMKE